MPVFEAQYVVLLSSKTGWSEYFIRWELPLSRGWAYFHMIRALDGERCRWPGRKSNVTKWVDGVIDWVRNAVTTRKPREDV